MHARAIADAARFLDDAYETLARNAREQREASGSGGPSWQHRLRVWWDRHPGGWPGRFPWFGPGLPGPWLPRLPLPRFPFPRGIFPWFDGRVVPMPSPIRPPVDLGPLLLPVLIGLGVAGWGRSGPSAPAPAPRGRSATPPSPPPGPRPGDASGQLSSGMSVDQAKAIHDKYAQPPYAPARGPDLQYQCVAWAVARWNQLREQAGLPPLRVNESHGATLAALNGGSTSNPPSLGAMASYGTGYGHVMIVEQISTGPGGATQIRVSEMNVGDTNYEVGLPSEFKDTRVFTRLPDGRWQSGSDPARTITFASLPR